MKAISLWQPWASLIATGAKKIETRSWPTSYRGPIAIHAALRRHKRETEELADDDYYCAALGVPEDQAFEYMCQLPRGFVVATAELVACKRVEDLGRPELWVPRKGEYGVWTEFDLGNYQRGRFGWMLENVSPLAVPLPWKGEQGLFDIPALHERTDT